MNFIKRDFQYFILMEIYFQINLWLMEHLTPPSNEGITTRPHHAVLFCAYIISSVNQSSGVGKIKKISQLSWLDDLCLVRQKYDILWCSQRALNLARRSWHFSYCLTFKNWNWSSAQSRWVCHIPFWWIYHCHRSKSTGKKTGKTHLCMGNPRRILGESW